MQIQVVSENPLYVLLDTSEGAGLRDLPIQVHTKVYAQVSVVNI